MSFFESLQNSAFTEWLLGSESIWAYPTVLTLHTVGLAALVGTSIVLQLRVLGVGSEIPLVRLRLLSTVVWVAFAINLVSGLVLFVTQAADRVTQPLFYVKLVSIAAALWLGQQATRALSGDSRPGGKVSRTRANGAVVLALWVVAIAAGRLMAYYTGA